MTESRFGPADDPHDLARFVEAQETTYAQALAELQAGRKRSHWMWFIFPQYRGLGRSEMAQRYAIGGLDEAGAYLRHPTLGPRLIECAEAVLEVKGRSANDIFGTPDDQKLRSCATLFAAVSRSDSTFDRLLARYFGGVRDERTMSLLGT